MSQNHIQQSILKSETHQANQFATKSIKKKRKIVMNFKLPANVQNPYKAIERLGGASRIYQIAKQLHKHEKILNDQKNKKLMKTQPHELVQLKNIAKFELTKGTVINLETKVACQVVGRCDRNGSIKHPVKVDFEFTPEVLADIYHQKDDNFLQNLPQLNQRDSMVLGLQNRGKQSDFKDISLEEGIEHVAPKAFLMDNLSYIGPLYRQPQDKINEEVFKKMAKNMKIMENVDENGETEENKISQSAQEMNGHKETKSPEKLKEDGNSDRIEANGKKEEENFESEQKGDDTETNGTNIHFLVKNGKIIRIEEPQINEFGQSENFIENENGDEEIENGIDNSI